ncbi:hypothetical protein ACVIGA_009044 [Bradyrhizobium sp. USDA 3240]|jgi:hypothetical protein
MKIIFDWKTLSLGKPPIHAPKESATNRSLELCRVCTSS